MPVPLLLLALSSRVLAAPADEGAILAEAWLTVPSPEVLGPLEATIGFSVSEGHRPIAGGWEQRIIASPRALGQLRDQGWKVRVSREDHRKGPPAGGYHAPEDGDALLRALAQAHEHAGFAVIGTSSDGRDLGALWVGVDPSLGAPTLRVLGAHHGDEWSSFEVALAAATALVESYGEDLAITELLDEQTIWVVPYVNPDGVMAGSRYSATDVDLNRNYDYQWSATAFRPGDAPFSEPETRAVRDLGLWTLPHASLSLHAGATNVGYVWNWSTEATPDETALVELAQDYLERCGTNGFYVTNGADWYITYGDTNDWSYGRYGGWDFTIELTGTKAPDDSLIEEFVADHLDAVLGFLVDQRAPTWFSITDSDGGALPARVRGDSGWEGANQPGSGTFARSLSDGEGLTLSVPGASPVASTGADVVITLDQALDALPSPRVASTPTVLELPEVAGPVTLWRPGAEPVVLEVVDGAIPLDPEGLAPGFWSLWDADEERGLPNAVFVDSEDVLRLTAVTVDGTWVTLEGTGWTEGARAYAARGASRALVELDVEPVGTSLILDLAGVDSSEPVDVVLVSNGSEEVVLDVLGTPWFDTTGEADTASDTGADPRDRACGCSSASSSSLLLFCLPLLRRRRLGR